MAKKQPMQPAMPKFEHVETGLTLFDIKRRRGTAGSEYDARSSKGIRTKGKKRKRWWETMV